MMLVLEETFQFTYTPDIPVLVGPWEGNVLSLEKVVTEG